MKRTIWFGFWVLVLMSGLNGCIIYVDAENANPGDGSSWETAVNTIQEAVDLAKDHDEIWIKKGTYVIPATLEITKRITLLGGFDGTEASQQRDWETNVTTIDGQGAHRGFQLNADATLDGLTITNCNAEPGNGGGILIENACPTVKHCKIESNEALDGGGLYLTNSSASIIDCRFYNNSAANNGSHIYNLDADSLFKECDLLEVAKSDYDKTALYISNDKSEAYPTFKMCAFKASSHSSGVTNADTSPVFIDCDFTDFTGDINGVDIMVNDHASPLIKNCRFENNHSANGSAMSTFNQSSPSIIDCTFSHNSSSESIGCMYNSGGSTPLIRGCLFEYNAGDDTAAILNQEADAMIENCIFRFNGGGAAEAGVVDNFNCAPVIRNCIFYNNYVVTTGGIMCDNAAPHIVNCVFFGNNGILAGAIVSQNNSNPLIANCIFRENSGDSPDIFGPAVVTYTDIDGGYNGQGNIDADPLFLDPANGDFHISALSPCVDKGTADVPYLPDTDFEGDPRIQGLAPDMGADET